MERTDDEGEREKRERERERPALLFASGASVECPMWSSVASKRGKIHHPRAPEGFGKSLRSG
jgi:hypothetical protein